MYSLIIFLSSLIGLIESHTSDATIGDYSQYIPRYDLCGLSMSSFEKLDKCFQFHQNMESPIKGGRDVREGEAPWVVDLYVNLHFPYWQFWGWFSSKVCSGTLISDQWILTAANCFLPDETNLVDVKVWFGPEYRKVDVPGTKQDHHYNTWQPIIHPLYLSDMEIDVALLQLQEPIRVTEVNRNWITNYICLPEINNTLKRNLLTYNSGWGLGLNSRLRIMTRIMNAQLENTVANLMNDAVIWRQPWYYGANGICMVFLCDLYSRIITIYEQGDTGAPAWQYVYGKAVLIGVHRGHYKGDCSSEDNTGVYIPKFIDWILETISNSTQNSTQP